MSTLFSSGGTLLPVVPVLPALSVARSSSPPSLWGIKTTATPFWTTKNSHRWICFLKAVFAVMSPPLSAHTGTGLTVNLSGR